MNKRKEPGRTSLPRIYFIDKRIAEGRYPSTRDLAAEWETSMSTISRDIDFMKAQLGAPIEYDPVRRGYYYGEKTYRLPAGFTTAEEMLALGMAKNMLELYRNTPVYEAANHLFESIIAPLNLGSSSPWYENRLIVPPFPSSPVPLHTWDCITTGIRENRVLAFDYCGATKTAKERRHVRPFQLIFDTGVWMLYGYAEERADTRLFSIPRMKNLVVTDATFTLPADYDYRKTVGDSNFGVFTSKDSYYFRVAFYDESVFWVRERQWAKDQSIEEREDGGIVISFTSNQFAKVLEWVLGCGATAVPLEPKELVEVWGENVRRMGEMVQGKEKL
jgi:predicted DNA-binding transcriptional regulator YafY